MRSSERAPCASSPRWQVLLDGEAGVVEPAGEHALVAGAHDVVVLGVGVDHRQEPGEARAAGRRSGR